MPMTQVMIQKCGFALAFIIIGSVLAGACSSGKSGTVARTTLPIVQTAQAGPTPTQYARQANSILVHHVTGTTLFLDASETNASDWQGRITNDIRNMESATELWAQLTPPASEAATYEKASTVLKQIANLGKQIEASVGARDMVALNRQLDMLDTLVQEVQPFVDESVLVTP
jgi:hypothetical protein